MEKCFADDGLWCTVLKVKRCNKCAFYKPLSSQIKVVVKQIKDYEDYIPKQRVRTWIRQAKKGDLEGARKGLDRVKKMNGL